MNKERKEMSKLNVLLCCGAGLSSGFLAQRTRAEAKKQKIELQIEARSESQVAQYLDTTDILLLGPHFSSQLPNYQDLAKLHNFKVAVIPQKVYGAMDAKGMLEMIRQIETEEDTAE